MKLHEKKTKTTPEEQTVNDTTPNDGNTNNAAAEAQPDAAQQETPRQDTAPDNSDKDKQNQELLDRLQRTLAEFDNFRKRTAKEKAGIYDEGIKDAIAKLLPVIDNFDRALGAAANKEDSFYKGVDMIHKQLYDILDDIGVKPVPTVGEAFDPNLHFAVAHETNPDYGENEIIAELQKGYEYKDKVIRAAMVKVAN